MHQRSKWLRWLAGFLAVAPAVVAAGCEEEQAVLRYTAPKAATSAMPKERGGARRVLAAIVVIEESTWVFKAVGPNAVVRQHADEFDLFLRSVVFTGKVSEPVRWTVPSGWRPTANTRLSYAAFEFGPAHEAGLVTVTPMGKRAGTLLENVNRWRERDLGLSPIDADALPRFAAERKYPRFVAQFVELSNAAER
jgi:hypothetical protein